MGPQDHAEGQRKAQVVSSQCLRDNALAHKSKLAPGTSRSDLEQSRETLETAQVRHLSEVALEATTLRNHRRRGLSRPG